MTFFSHSGITLDDVAVAVLKKTELKELTLVARLVPSAALDDRSLHNVADLELNSGP